MKWKQLNNELAKKKVKLKWLKIMIQQNQNTRKRKYKKGGRKRIKHSFDETRIGHLLKHEAPLEYGLITSAIKETFAPSPDFIESIGYSSDNPLFRKPKFRRSLIEYRKYGLYSGRPIRPSGSVELYYIKIRKAQRCRDIKTASNVKK